MMLIDPLIKKLCHAEYKVLFKKILAYANVMDNFAGSENRNKYYTNKSAIISMHKNLNRGYP